MRSGEMDELLKVLQPVVTTNSFGEEHTSWEIINTIHAQRASLSGRRNMEVGETFPDYTMQFNIRWAHKVEENWRVQHVGGYLYSITHIEPNKSRGMKTLFCERVNE